MNFRNVRYFGLATCTHCPSVSVISAISVISPRQDGQGGMVVLVRKGGLRVDSAYTVRPRLLQRTDEVLEKLRGYL